MKVLQLSYRLPVPPKDGGAIGIWHLLKAYAALGHELHFSGFNTDKHHIDETLAQSLLAPYVKKADFIPLKTTPTAFGALQALLNRQSYHIRRFESKAMEKQIVEKLQAETFDLIHLDGVFMAPYIDCIRKHSKAKIILRAHNIEFKIWEGLAESSVGIKKYYLQLLARQLKKYEQAAWQKVDNVAAINPEEQRFIQQYQKSTLLEAGWFPENATIQTASNDFFHIGSMEWMPNKVGMEWFLKEVWPAFYQQHPTAKLHLAGRGLNQEQRFPAGVINHGEVESAKLFMQTHGTMLVPLFHGAGVRIKIIEALSLGIPVLSTVKGVEGLTLEPAIHYFQANSKEEWLEKMNSLHSNKDTRIALQKAAHSFAAENLSQTNFLGQFLHAIFN